MRTLVVDNGAYTIKAGFATENATYADCQVIPNCIARSRDRRVLVGAQLHTCRDFGGMQFRRPVEKGYLVNWEAEREIFDRSFIAKDAPLRCDPSETTLLLTEAPNAPVSLQSNTDQMVFEEFEFARYSRCVGQPLSRPPAPDSPALMLHSSLPHPLATTPHPLRPGKHHPPHPDPGLHHNRHRLFAHAHHPVPLLHPPQPFHPAPRHRR